MTAPKEPIDDDDARARKLKADKLEIELAALKGHYMLNETHEEICAGIGLEVVRCLDMIERRLPPRLDMITAREAQQILHEAHKDMRDRLERKRGGPLKGIRRGRGRPPKKKTA